MYWGPLFRGLTVYSIQIYKVTILIISVGVWSVFYKKVIIYKSGTLIMALQKHGQVWSHSYLVKTNISLIKSNHGQLFDHVHDG